MYIVRILILRLLIDQVNCELRGSVTPVATQEAHLFEDSSELLEILRGLAQDDGLDLDGKNRLHGELK